MRSLLLFRRWRRILLTLVPLVFALLHVSGKLSLPLLDRLDQIFYDARLRLSMPRTLDERIVIVDIDEKSLAEVGRWPWARHHVARLVAAMLAAAPGAVRVLRDPTRGGLATTLNEVARQSGVGMLLQEAAIPVKPQVDAACELLGLDPLYVANEGKLIAVVAPEFADAVLAAMRAHPLGGDAARIGEVTADPHHFVQMATRFGGRRVVDWLSGEQLPRIC